MYMIHTNTLYFHVCDHAETGLFCSRDGVMRGRQADFWRILIEQHGEQMTLSSVRQRGIVTHENFENMRIQYLKLLDDYGNAHEIILTIEICAEGDRLVFSSALQNNTRDVTILRCDCPIVRIEHLFGDKEKDCLYLPIGLGRRLMNPWVIKMQLTNILNPYYRKMSREEWLYQFNYPGGCMAWMGVESYEHFLYMGRHDDLMSNCRFFAGTSIPSNTGALMMLIAHEPALKPGAKYDIPKCVVALLETDWQGGAALYREFAQKAMIKGRCSRNNATTAHNYRHVLMRNGLTQYYTYSDLPSLFTESKAMGIDGLLLFGWWDSPIDVAQPEKFLSQESRLNLIKAIHAIHDMNGYITLSIHNLYPERYGLFCQRNSQDIACTDMQGKVFLSEYCYQAFDCWESGHRARITACCYVPAWLNAMKAVNRIICSCEADSVLYQALGTPIGLSCYQEDHDHRTDAGLWHAGMEEMFTTFAPDIQYGTSYAYDGAINYADFILADDDAYQPVNDNFPQLFRHSFPEVPIMIRLERHGNQDMPRSLLFSFLMGYRIDLADGDISLLALMGDLDKINKRFACIITEGRFSCHSSTMYVPGICDVEYASKMNNYLRIIWNTGDKIEEIDENRIQPNGLLFLIRGEGETSFTPVLSATLENGRIHVL